MAFNLQNFQFARGVDTSYAQGQGVTTVLHSYKSSVDTIATITTSGYFPDYIDGDIHQVFVNDQIMIIGSDSTALVNILTLSPITVSADWLSSGAGITIGAPVAATDDNGLVIAGNILKAQLANVGHAGILSDTTQTISGLKVFPDGVNIGSGANPAFTVFNGLDVAVTWTGPFTASQAGSIHLQQVNNMLYCTVTGIVDAAQNTGAYITSGVVIPAAYRPLADVHDVIRVTDGVAKALGVITVLVNGTILMGVNATNDFFSGANFAGSGDKVLGWKLS